MRKRDVRRAGPQAGLVGVLASALFVLGSETARADAAVALLGLLPAKGAPVGVVEAKLGPLSPVFMAEGPIKGVFETRRFLTWRGVDMLPVWIDVGGPGFRTIKLSYNPPNGSPLYSMPRAFFNRVRKGLVLEFGRPKHVDDCLAYWRVGRRVVVHSVFSVRIEYVSDDEPRSYEAWNCEKIVD